jgi:hypothetical protein
MRVVLGVDIIMQFLSRMLMTLNAIVVHLKIP